MRFGPPHLEHDCGTCPQRSRILHDFRTRLPVGVVAKLSGCACGAFDCHRIAELGELLHRLRCGGDPSFARMHFLGNANSHNAVPLLISSRPPAPVTRPWQPYRNGTASSLDLPTMMD